MKKKLLLFTIVSLLILFLCVSPLSAGAASGYKITINDDGKLADNGKLLFYEKEVAPGFLGEYKIDVINNYSETFYIYVEKIIAESTAPYTDDFFFSFKGGALQASGSIGDFTPNSPVVLAVPGGEKAVLNLTMGLNSSAGNSYQNSITTFNVTFCAASNDKPISPDSPSTSFLTNVKPWYIILLVSVLIIVIMLPYKKRRREEYNEQEG